MFQALYPLQGRGVPHLLGAGPLQGGTYFTATEYIKAWICSIRLMILNELFPLLTEAVPRAWDSVAATNTCKAAVLACSCPTVC